MQDAIDSGAAVRLFALVPFDIGRTMSLGLGQSGGKALVTFAPLAGDAKTACGAPFRLALIMWESPLAAVTSPLSPAPLDALRDWASLSSCLEEPEVELRAPLRPLAAGPCTFERTKVYFAPTLLNAGLPELGSTPRAHAHLTAVTRLSLLPASATSPLLPASA